MADEKLASAGVASGVSHRKATALVFYFLIVAFANYPPAGTSRASTVRAAALDYEIRDYAVKI